MDSTPEKPERSSLIQFFLDETDGGNRTKGEPYLQNQDQDRMFCPKCLNEIWDQDAGYGLAYGGMGTYWCCEQEGCDWFYKIMDMEQVDEG